MKYKDKILSHTESIGEKVKIIVKFGIEERKMSPEQIMSAMNSVINETETLENMVSLERNDVQFSQIKSKIVNWIQSINNKSVMVREGIKKNTMTPQQALNLLNAISKNTEKMKNVIGSLDKDFGFK